MNMYPKNMQSNMQTDEEITDAAFEAMLTRTLEHSASVPVPTDFAARVRSSLPPPPRPRRTIRIGRLASLTGACVLAASMFLLAPHAAPTFSNLAFDLELVAIVQLAGIGYLLTARKDV